MPVYSYCLKLEKSFIVQSQLPIVTTQVSNLTAVHVNNIDKLPQKTWDFLNFLYILGGYYNQMIFQSIKTKYIDLSI